MARTRNLGDTVLYVGNQGRVPAVVSATTGVDTAGVASATGATLNVFDRRSPLNKAVPAIQNTDGATAATWDFASLSGVKLTASTLTEAGTEGEVNAPSGSFVLALGEDEFTLTNSFISATSIVDCGIRTAGDTVIIWSVVPADGEVVVTLSGNVAADTTISFVVINGN